MKETIIELLGQALETLKADGTLPADASPQIKVDPTKDKSHGDYASNLAMMTSKAAGMKPRDLAEKLIAALPASDAVSKVEIAGPGFLNFFADTGAVADIVRRVFSENDSFGHSDVGAGEKVQVEFVSANPTGPLHVGHGRGAAVGDVLCRLLAATGHTSRASSTTTMPAPRSTIWRSPSRRAPRVWARTMPAGRPMAIAVTTSANWPPPTWPATPSKPMGSR